MVPASQLRAGMAIRHEGQIFKVLAAEYHGGQGKMGGGTHARLKNLTTGTLWEHSFRADLKVEDLEVAKQSMDFLYSDGDLCYFMNPDTFEQVGGGDIGDRRAGAVPDAPDAGAGGVSGRAAGERALSGYY